MNKNFLPTVSVIIPAFNAEKYIGACLESLAIQTFTDYEVIVVDDCSTDNSRAVAENFLEQFGGRMKIFSLPQNTGSGAIPRNEGLKFSRGEYVFFIDADDLLSADALAELYTAAKNFRADVVCMKRGFICEADDTSKIVAADWDKLPAHIDAPTLETADIAERMEKFLRTGYSFAPWTKFLRRDFLLANDIKFPNTRPAEDVIWTIELICLAERWLTLPTRLYTYRKSDDSMMGRSRSPQDEIIFRLHPLIHGVDFLDDFMRRVNFFEQNPNYRFKVTNFFVKMQLAGMLDAMDKVYFSELYEMFCREFSKGNGRHAALIANLLIFMSYYRNKH